MKKYWRQILAGLLALILLALGLDIRFGIFSGSDRYLPVLMYHHFDDALDLSTTISGGRFREQMTALKDAGFTAVSLAQVRDYVDSGVPLPEKPVLITMDDGYASNLNIAAPVLEELGFCATIFVIGFYEGEVLDLHTGNPIWEERFAFEDALPWVEKGVLDVQSHSFDMHWLAEDGVTGRDGMLRKDGESDAAYFQAIRDDLRQFRQRREGKLPTDLTALAFPYGYWSDDLDQVLTEEGIGFTFTIAECSNRLRIGHPECLHKMGRFNVTEECSGKKLVRRLEWAAKNWYAVWSGRQKEELNWTWNNFLRKIPRRLSPSPAA